MASWRIPGFVDQGRLGKGGYGIVNQLAYSRDKKYKFAVKRVEQKNDQLSFANRHELNETLFNHCLKQIHVDGYRYGFFELFQGTVDDMQISGNNFQQIGKLLFSAFACLFEKRLIHNDIKLSNILQRNGCFRLNDYSLSQFVQHGEESYFIEELTQIVYCLYEAWCKLYRRTFQWSDFYKLESRTEPLLTLSQETEEYFYNHLDLIQDRFKFIGLTMKQILRWQDFSDINVHNLKEFYTNTMTAVIANQERNTQITNFLNWVYENALKNLKTLAKARHKNRVGLRTSVCEICGRGYGYPQNLAKHKSLKHPQSTSKANNELISPVQSQN